MYAYARNNPTTNIDPDGEDCISTSDQTSTSVTVTITAGGNCSPGQTYVGGTIDINSLTYNGTSLGYSFTPYDTNVSYGIGSLSLGASDKLSPSAQAILGSVYQLANGPVNFFAAATFLPLSFYGPLALIDSFSLPMSLGLEEAAAPEITAADGTKITGFNKHGIDRAVGEGAPGVKGVRAGTRPQAILDALKNPKSIRSGVDAQGRPYKVFTGKDARVVVNPQSGEIVSTNPTSGAGAH
jgi:hypothetical protein